jgi:hypothetical protein
MDLRQLVDCLEVTDHSSDIRHMVVEFPQWNVGVGKAASSTTSPIPAIYIEIRIHSVSYSHYALPASHLSLLSTAILSQTKHLIH